MQEEPERIDADPSDNCLFFRTVDTSRSNHYIWNPEVLVVFGEKLLLFEFRKAVGLATEIAMLFNCTRFVEKLAPLVSRSSCTQKTS